MNIAPAAKIALKSVRGIEVVDPEIAKLRDRAVGVLEHVDSDDHFSVAALRMTSNDVTKTFAERAPDWFVRISDR